jgi:hypothetical protein
MPELDAILQPDTLRTGRTPAWAFFPKLRLLLGWGIGVRETLGDERFDARTMFLLRERNVNLGPDEQLFVNEMAAHDATRPVRPFYLRSLAVNSCRIAAANALTVDFAGPKLCTESPCFHALEANDDLRLACSCGPTDVRGIEIERRIQSMKPEHASQLPRFGISEDDVSAFMNRPDGAPQDPRETAFFTYLKGATQSFHERRLRELVVDVAARPASFPIRLAELALRRNAGCAADGSLPDYDMASLTADTCLEIASREATEQVFDATWVPVLRFDADGLKLY